MVAICVSCAKEPAPEQESATTGVREFIANIESVQTKTVLDADLSVKWGAGDAISVFDEAGKIVWQPNPKYAKSELICKTPDAHPELGIVPGEAIYTTFEKDNNAFGYVVHPELKADVWENYIP